jgi:hypothetical protein
LFQTKKLDFNQGDKVCSRHWLCQETFGRRSIDEKHSSSIGNQSVLCLIDDECRLFCEFLISVHIITTCQVAPHRFDLSVNKAGARSICYFGKKLHGMLRKKKKKVVCKFALCEMLFFSSGFFFSAQCCCDSIGCCFRLFWIERNIYFCVLCVIIMRLDLSTMNCHTSVFASIASFGSSYFERS